MFASPKKRDKVVNNKEVEKTFTTIVIPLIHETKDKDCFLSPKKPSTLFVSNSYGNSFSNSNSTKDSVGNDNRNRDGDCCDDNNITKNKSNSYDDHHRKSNSASAPSTTRARATNRTGGRNSFTTFSYDKITLLPAESKRVYKVLSIKDNSNNYSNSYSNYNSNSDSLGRKLLFDGISGKIYHCGAGQAKNISKNVICFDTKDSALSERFPYDQFGGGKGGNGVYPRVLVAFDAWGKCTRRHGGGASCTYEYARYINVVRFLDPPHPVPQRSPIKCKEPFYWPPPDVSPPGRGRSDRFTKTNKMFTSPLKAWG